MDPNGLIQSKNARITYWSCKARSLNCEWKQANNFEKDLYIRGEEYPIVQPARAVVGIEGKVGKQGTWILESWKGPLLYIRPRIQGVNLLLFRYPDDGRGGRGGSGDGGLWSSNRIKRQSLTERLLLLLSLLSGLRWDAILKLCGIYLSAVKFQYRAWIALHFGLLRKIRKGWSEKWSRNRIMPRIRVFCVPCKSILPVGGLSERHNQTEWFFELACINSTIKLEWQHLARASKFASTSVLSCFCWTASRVP